MTDDDRAIIERINGDKLTQAIKAYAAEPTADNLAAWAAELINRSAAMAASAVVHVDKRIDALIEAMHGT